MCFDAPIKGSAAYTPCTCTPTMNSDNYLLEHGHWPVTSESPDQEHRRDSSWLRHAMRSAGASTESRGALAHNENLTFGAAVPHASSSVLLRRSPGSCS